MPSYVYRRCSPEPLLTVGFYTPDGEWVPDSDHDNREDARRRVHYLNGGTDQVRLDILEKRLDALEAALGSIVLPNHLKDLEE